MASTVAANNRLLVVASMRREARKSNARTATALARINSHAAKGLSNSGTTRSDAAGSKSLIQRLVNERLDQPLHEGRIAGNALSTKSWNGSVPRTATVANEQRAKLRRVINAGRQRFCKSQ